MISFFARIFFLGWLLSGTVVSGTPADWIPSPVVVVAENVNVSVGESASLVVGRYWYQYVAKLDDKVSPRIAIYYAIFVPSGTTSAKDLIETSAVKLMLGEKVFYPETARLLTDEETGPLQAAPKDASVAWFIFQIPRELAKLRFDVLISHFQPHSLYDHKTITAYLPWLPELEAQRRDLEIFDKDLVITFEALPDVKLQLESVNSKVETKTATQIVVHPLHWENIAVAVGKK